MQEGIAASLLAFLNAIWPTLRDALLVLFGKKLQQKETEIETLRTERDAVAAAEQAARRVDDADAAELERLRNKWK